MSLTNGAARMADPPHSRWLVILVVVVAVAVLGLMVFLHLTGTMGPGLHQAGTR
jgi:hypothetical protein